MKKSYLSVVLLVAAFCITAVLPSCMFNCVKGSGHRVSESRKMTDFTKVNIDGDYKINLKQDSSLTVNITADDNLLKYIKTDVRGNTLHIHSRKTFCNSNAMVINVGIRNLDELTASGAIEVTADGVINVKDLDFDLSGASKITMDINAANLITKGSGATELNLKGQASSHHIDMSGDAKVHALDFVVGDYNIETSGASNCEINVLHGLNVHSSGASEVKYRGNPTSVNNDKSGASSLEKIN